MKTVFKIWLLTFVIGTIAAAQQREMVVYKDATIFVMNADGSELRPLTRAKDHQWQGSPTLSPSGEMLAWDAHRPGLQTPSVFIAQSSGEVRRLIDGIRPFWLDNQTLGGARRRDRRSLT